LADALFGPAIHRLRFFFGTAFRSRKNLSHSMAKRVFAAGRLVSEGISGNNSLFSLRTIQLKRPQKERFLIVRLSLLRRRSG
jgi:hypothetical protein